MLGYGVKQAIEKVSNCVIKVNEKDQWTSQASS
jgi:hypothetical protein